MCRLIFITAFMLISSVAFSQKQQSLSLNEKEVSSYEVAQSGADGFVLDIQLGPVQFTEQETQKGVFEKIYVDGLVKSFRAGYPDLPSYNRVIKIPQNKEVRVEVIESDEKVVELDKKGISHKIIPAQPPAVKDRPIDSFDLQLREEVYTRDQFTGRELLKYEEAGIMRGTKLGRIEINPFRYNPARNVLEITHKVRVKIHFVSTGKEANINNKEDYNPYFHQVKSIALNTGIEEKALPTSSPITYVVISDRMFEDELQPLIEWKRLKGFHVKEGYTDSIGTSRSEIKAYLKDLYENPDPTPPTFVLFVGDIDIIPSWSGETGSHYTDLYYCEYTGDYFPEVFYGRFSADTEQQVQIQVDKTLGYEKLEMADPAYLSEALLVAGDDASYESTHANGQINYATSYYFNEANDITAHAYLQDPPNGNSAIHDSIMSNISRGVSLANYTAHCSPSGWSNPRLSNSDITNLTNQDKYGIWIGNCCESARFEYNESFAENALRAENKGAIGYVGGSADTYWDEDYWWAVGLTSSIVADPTYEESSLGIFDRMFHTHEEDISEWYIAQGQIPAAGNLAVESSSSSLRKYYWEVYHLLGDPSVMPYLKKPGTSSLSVSPDELVIGMNDLTVNTEPYAYVGLSLDGQFLAAGTADENGDIKLNFDPLEEPGQATLVVTAQNKKPAIKEISIIASDEPYISFEEYSLEEDTNNQADYGDTLRMNIRLRNLSNSDPAHDLKDTLFTNDPYITLLDSIHTIDSIGPAADTIFVKAFTFVVSDSIEDQHKAEFEYHITGKSDADSSISWENKFSITLNAPKLEIGSITVKDNQEGNGDNIFDPGETANLEVEIQNKGHAVVSNVSALLNVPAGNPYITLIDSAYTVKDAIGAGSSGIAVFKVSADELTPAETVASLEINTKAGEKEQFYLTRNREVIIGDVPDYRISEADSVYTCSANFFDSGGPENYYSNDESHIITFLPAGTGNRIRAVFKEFAVEDTYDQLTVYNGPGSESAVLGNFDNSNPPDTLLSTDTSGALTFKFSSDYSIRKSGWEAYVACVDSVEFTVTDDSGPIEGAKITVNDFSSYSNSNGKAWFLLEEKKYSYTVNKGGYHEVTGIVNVSESTEKQVILEPRNYTVTFRLFDDKNQPIEGEVRLGDSVKSTQDAIVSFKNREYGSRLPYTATAPECNPVKDEVTIHKDTTVDVTLNPVYYELTFNVKDKKGNIVQNAEVVIDTIVQQTDLGGKTTFMLKKGEYSLFIAKEKFVKYTDTLTVEDSSELDITMTNLYDIEFAVECDSRDTVIYNSQIQIDTFALSTDRSGRAVASIPYGSYELIANAEGYTEFRENVAVDSDKTMIIRMSPERDVYYLEFTVKNGENDLIDNAEISIDTFNVKTDFFGKANVGLTIGDYDYSVSADGYRDYDSTLTLSGDTTLNVKMQESATFAGPGVEDYDLQIYPNPTDGMVNIESSVAMEGRLVVRNVIGLKIIEKSLDYVRNVSIDLNSYESGIYLFSIELENHKTTRKILHK